jgi:hypothetical protein
MHSVNIPGAHITASQLAAILRQELGSGYQVSPRGDDQVKVRKGISQRARITITREPGATEIDTRGESIRLPIPLYYVISRQTNDRGIAARCADIISHSAQLRDTP